MERAHWWDSRKGVKKPYLHHQFEIISDYLDKYDTNEIHLWDILILLLHDVLEDHPEYWREILDKFWLKVFRDVLVLSTWWIDSKYRKKMLRYFNDTYNEHFILSEPWDKLHDIWHIIDPAPPLRKLSKNSIYSKNRNEHELYAMKKAINYYSKVLLKIDPDEYNFVDNDEYIWLWNYIYMNPTDVRRKLQDMLNNMKDMKQMEDRKPWYIAKRHIKAYILTAKMKNFWMNKELSELLIAFAESGHPLIQWQIEQKLSGA